MNQQTDTLTSSRLNIGLSEANRAKVAEELGKLLADEYVLYTKTRHAHWNVKGPDFYEKHTFFETQYTQLDEIIDNVAERIRALGFTSPASMKAFLELSQLNEEELPSHSSEAFIEALLADHERIILRLREQVTLFDETYNDMGTSDFVTGLMEEHEKMAWFLRAHLGG